MIPVLVLQVQDDLLQLDIYNFNPRRNRSWCVVVSAFALLYIYREKVQAGIAIFRTVLIWENNKRIFRYLLYGSILANSATIVFGILLDHSEDPSISYER